MADYTLSAKATFDGSNFNSGVSKSASSLDKFRSKCDSISSKTSGSFGKIVKAAAGVTTAVAGIATGMVLKGGIDRALNIEQAQYKLKQLGLDVNAVMESANKAVQGTAHSLDQAVTVASSLGASGVQAGDEMTNALQAVAGMATISGRSMQDIGLIFGKVAAQGRVQGDELMQFAESGIDVTSALAKHFGTTQAAVREMVTEGKVGFQDFAAAMHEAYGEAAYGANETFNGALANMQAALSRMGEKFATPALEALKGVFQNAIPAIDQFSTALDPLAQKFGEFAKEIGSTAVSGLKTFTSALEAGATPIHAFKAAILDMFGAEWGGAINSIVQAFQNVGSVIGNVIKWFASLDSGTQVAIAQFVALAAAIRPFISIITSVAGKIAGFASTIAKIGSALANFGSRFSSAASGVQKLSSSTSSAASGIKRLSSAASSAASSVGTIASSASKVPTVLQGINTNASKAARSMQVVTASVKPAASSMSQLGKGINTTFSGLAKSVGQTNALNVALRNIGVSSKDASTKMQYLAKMNQSANIGFRTTGAAAQTVSKNLGAISTGAQKASSGMKNVATSAKTASTGMKLAASAGNLLKGALASIGVGLAIGAVTTAIGAFVDNIAKAKERTEIFNKSLKGVDFGAYKDGFDNASVNFSTFRDSLRETADDIDTFARKQAELNDSLADTLKDAGQKSGLVEYYEDVITTLGNTGKQLDELSQQKLKYAVEQFNELTGSEIKIADIDTGTLDTATEKVHRLADEFEYLALKQAASEVAAEKAKAVFEAQLGLEGAKQAKRNREAERDKYGNTKTGKQKDWETYIGQADKWIRYWEQQLETAQADLDRFTQLAEQAGQKAAEAARGIADALKENADFDFSDWANKAGTNLEDVSASLEQFGFTTKSLGDLNQEQLQKLVTNWDKSSTELVQLCNEMGIDVPNALETMAREATQALDSTKWLSGWSEETGVSVDQAVAKLHEFGLSVEDLSTMTPDMLSQMMNGSAKSLDAFITECESAGVSVPQAFKDMVADIQDPLKQLSGALSDFGNEGGIDALSQKVDMSVEEMSTALNDFGVTADQVKDRAPEMFMALANAADTSVSEMVQKFTDAGVEVPQAIKDWASAFDELKTKFAEVGNDDSFTTFTSKLGVGLEDAVTKFKDTSFDLENISSETVENIANAFGKTPGDVMEALSSADIDIPKTVQEWFDGLPEEMKQTGTEAGEGLTEGVEESAEGGGDTVVDKLLETAQGHEGEFTEIGRSLGNSLSSGFALADMLSTSDAINNLVQSISGRADEMNAIGVSWGNALSTGFATADMLSTSGAIDALVQSISIRSDELNAIGVSWGNALSTGFATADMASTQAAITALIASLSLQAPALMMIGMSWGMALSMGFTIGTVMTGQTAVATFTMTLMAQAPMMMTVGMSWATALAMGFSTGAIMSTSIAVMAIVASLTAQAPVMTAIGMAWGVALAAGLSLGILTSAITAASVVVATLSAMAGEMTGVGISWGNALSSGLATGASTGAGAAVQSLLASCQGHDGEFSAQGNAYGAAFASGFASADMGAAASAVASLASTIGGHEGEFRSAGEAAGNAYAQGFAGANVTGATAVVTGLLSTVQGMQGAFTAAGTEAGNAFAGGFAAADMSAVSNIVQAALSEVQAMASEFATAGSEAGGNFAKGISSQAGSVSAAASSYTSSVRSALSSASSTAYSSGSHVGAQFAAGIRSKAGAVASAAAALAAAAKANIGHSKPKEGPLRMGEEIFGRHLAQNFAKGIEKGAFYVTRASKGVAQAVVDYLGHSQPAKGPLSKGEHVFGEHAIQNFAEGIRKGAPDVEKQAKNIAQIVFDYIGHSNPAKGPLSPGEWIFGVHTATNYAEGLGSAEAKDRVTGAVDDLTDAAKKAWDEGLLAAYKDRTGEMKDMTTDLADFMNNAFTSMFSPDKITSARGNGKGVFGLHEPVYTSIEKIYAAGYDSVKAFVDKDKELKDQYLKDQEDYAKGREKYDKKIADIRADADRDLRDAWERRNEQLERGTEEAWKVERDYNEKVEDIIKRREEQIDSETESWQREVDAYTERNNAFAEFNELKGSLGTNDYLWLAENEQIFKLQYEIEVGDDQAQTALQNIQKLSQKTGVVFSKSFVERIMQGSDEAMSLLDTLANATAEDVKQMSDAWYDYEQLQREQEIETRALWVNSLTDQRTGVQQLRDLLMDYKETVLDVKEALASDDGLASAFEMAGVSAEGFALDLESVDMTMSDFSSMFTSFTEQVSNGFRAMDSFSQTSLKEWEDNLNHNMAESQAFAKNVEKVFNSIPDGVDADLFRKAVLQGGFDQWGHIIADLANSSASEITKAVELYNKSIVEGQQSAIQQVQAIAPGEEYMRIFMAGVENSEGDITQGMVNVMSGVAGETSESYMQSLMDGIEEQRYNMEKQVAQMSRGIADKTGIYTAARWEHAGDYLSQGLESGILGRATDIANAAAEVVRQAIAAAQAAAEIHSPSRKTMWIGQMFDKGLSIGMNKYSGLVAKSAASIMDMPGAAIDALPELPNYVMNTRSTSGIHGVGDTNNYTYGDVNVNATVSNEVDIRHLGREIARFQDHRGRIRGYQQ